MSSIPSSKTFFFLAALAILIAASPAWAETGGKRFFEVSYLDPFEPNTIGYTFDDDDVPFLDVKLSVKASLAPFIVHKAVSDLDLYLGLTGRFGQYIGTRRSSPVIGKRYNPELFFRYRLNSDSHLDLGYAHESNGQAITTEEEFDEARANAEREDFAADQISRGWDYIRLSLKTPTVPLPDSIGLLNAYLIHKYFLNYGFLQGEAEEYNNWEDDPEGKRRDEVNGVGLILRAVWPLENEYINAFKTALVYETGYRPVFRYNSYRVELGVKIIGLPVIGWISSGYNSDLAQYYKRVTSWGVAYEIGGF